MKNIEITKKTKIGDLLVHNKVISSGQLSLALQEQKESGKKIGRIIVDLGFITEDRLLNSLSEQLNIPFVDIKYYQFDKKIIEKIPESFARRYRVIGLSEDDAFIFIGMVDPTNLYIIDEIQSITKKTVKQAIIREFDLLKALDSIYRKTEEISHIANELALQLKSNVDYNLDSLVTDKKSSDAPVVRLLYSIFQDAIQIKASDIHIEPDENMVRIRQRIDGILHEQVMKEKQVASALVLRLKVMAGLDISEKRLPQDGRFNIKVNEKKIDVRISTLPVQFGESVVLRLLDQDMGLLKLDTLGMPEKMLLKFKDIIRYPNGMILVTGPTGSGKTTTLYMALNELNDAEKKIITVEDPVEYRLTRISQVQINPKIGLTFSHVLRSSLRQDPDIILVGEMRDQETVDVGMRAAMTGHLVFSTLHTNDAASAVLRLIDMGSEPYLIANALKVVIAQRLVRKICVNCKTTYQLSERERNIFSRLFLEKMPNCLSADYHIGKGCHQCHNSGYIGRMGVFELLEINEELNQALRGKKYDAFYHLVAINPDFETISLNALKYASKGIISTAEVLRLIAEKT